MLLKIHGGEYEECRLLGCDAVLLATANVVPNSLVLSILVI
jgi:hypothetical protein